MAALVESVFFLAVEATAVRFHLDCCGFLCFVCLRLFYILCGFRGGYLLCFCDRLSRIGGRSGHLYLSLNWLSHVLDRFSFVLYRLSFDCLRLVLGRLGRIFRML